MNVSVRVECYSGYTYAQEPRAFEWRGRRYEVKHIVKRWRTPQGPGFRVELASAGQVVEGEGPGRGKPGSEPLAQTARLVDLVYLEVEDRWIMTTQT